MTLNDQLFLTREESAEILRVSTPTLDKLLREGDIIAIDAEKGTIAVELSAAELAARRAAWKPKLAQFGSGALWRYAKNVGPARYGAVTAPGAAEEVRCYADI